MYEYYLNLIIPHTSYIHDYHCF